MSDATTYNRLAMADRQQFNKLRQGVGVWNAWIDREDVMIDLEGADLRGLDLKDAYLREGELRGAKLNNADIRGADLFHANVREADLTNANLARADLSFADLRNATLVSAYLEETSINQADLRKADLSDALIGNADLSGANLTDAKLINTKLQRSDLSQATLIRTNLAYAQLGWVNLDEACLVDSDLGEADLRSANLKNADMSRAYLWKADLGGANLTDANLAAANLGNADLSGAVFVRTNLTKANLNGCRIYGLSAWDVKLTDASQANMIITPEHQPSIQVDRLDVAQFVYLMLNNSAIRHVIDTITSKAVLILGRFSEQRKPVLDAIRMELRQRNYLPILFDWEKPSTRDITETVSALAHMSKFVIADITDAKSIPQELMAIVPNLPSVPVQPIILLSQREYGMFEHFRNYRSVLPIAVYRNQAELLSSLEQCIIAPAEAKLNEIRAASLRVAPSLRT